MTKVLNVEEYWTEPPPTPSPKLQRWLDKIAAGWRPNRRIGGMGYYEAAEFYQVYIWEYNNVIRSVLEKAKTMSDEIRAAAVRAVKEKPK